MVEERTVAVLSGLELLEESCKQRHMKAIDLGNLCNLVGIVTVMGQRMVRFRHAYFWVGASTRLSRELKGDDPSDVGPQGQHLEIEHQLRVVGVRRRHTHGAIKIRQFPFGGRGFRLLDPAFHLANGVQVLADLGPVFGAKSRLQARRVLDNPVEEARLATQGLPAIIRGSAFSKKALEDHPRMGFRRQRRGRGGPREIVLVHAREPVVALPHH